MRGADWPLAGDGQSVGLLGGSFDPPHSGHLAVSQAALARFGLDRVWWLVSPGNPLKSDAPADLDRRMATAEAMVRDPRIVVTRIESRIQTRYTADTVAELSRLYPRVRLVWLMGADNLVQFHLWDRWRDIAATLPLGILARPGSRLAALNAPAARAFGSHRVAPGRLAMSDPPAWSFVTFPMRAESSSALRASGAWDRRP